ncbi:unnamed protein product [Paramecium primaurelia]|uniref:Rho-GAP domain-containing protein n=1 Tax=Paramecium primaurelia TaxID=5886 RepID=A0A8S1P3F6_PARPR|nr:unnamed protein product [Paramecium primaurelia]
MNQGKQYEIQGLLKAGIDKNQQPIYVMLHNLIIKNKNEEEIAKKFESYLQQFRPFKGFVLIICSQNDGQMNAKDVKHLIKKTLKKVEQIQLKRIDKLIIISNNQNYGKKEKSIPFSLKNLLKEKLHFINNVSFLDTYDIELHQSILKFLCNQIEYQEQQSFYGRDLDSYPIGQSGLPIFLEEIIKYYTQNTNCLLKEGIFRLSGSHEEEMKLVEQLLQQNYEAIQYSEPDVIATVLKNTLVNLKNPIFPFEIYAILRDTNPQIPTNEFVDMFSIFFAHLSKVNRLTVFKLVEFIKFIAGFEKENRMDLHNLSIVFAPCFFRTKEVNQLDYQGAMTVVLHFKSLIQNIDSFLEQQKRLSL